MHEPKNNVSELKNVSTVFVHTMKVIRAQNNTVCTIVCTKKQKFFKIPQKKECQVWNDVRLGELSLQEKQCNNYLHCLSTRCLPAFCILIPTSLKKLKVAKEEAPFDVCCDDMSRFPWGMKAPIPFSPDRKPEHFTSMSPSLICLTSHSNVSVSRPLSPVLPYFIPHF